MSDVYKRQRRRLQLFSFQGSDAGSRPFALLHPMKFDGKVHDKPDSMLIGQMPAESFDPAAPVSSSWKQLWRVPWLENL